MMIAQHPVECISKAMAHAVYEAFPLITYEAKDFSKVSHLSARDVLKAEIPLIEKQRKHFEDECEIIAMFAENWASTALGFGGIGGAAITRAYTIVIASLKTKTIAVYWRGQHAYTLTDENNLDAFFEDIYNNRKTASRRDAKTRYSLSIKED